MCNKLRDLLMVLLLATSTGVLADDGKMYLSADSAVLNGLSGTATYEGNVAIIQGEIKIEADTVKLQKSKDQKLDFIVAHGNPARLYDLRDPAEPLNANGDKIHYSISQKKIELIGRARLTQGERIFEGESILYDVQKERIEAEASADQRVKLVIPSLLDESKPAAGNNKPQEQE